MAGSLKRFIQQQLKENVPLAEIKKDLQEKGYGIEMINKAVREAIGGMDRKLHSSTIIQIGVLIVGVVIAVGVAVYFTIGYRSGEDLTTTTISLCEKFSNNMKACENAVNFALSNYQGNVTSVDKKNISLNTKKPPEIATVQVDAWLVTVHLENPVLLPKLNDTQYKSYDVEIAIDSEIKSILYVQTKGLVL